MSFVPSLGREAIRAAGLAVNALRLEAAPEIRAAVPLARNAALALKATSESTDWKIGDFTRLPIAIFQNWLYEQNREWHFTDGALAVLWCTEFPNSRSDYAERHRYIASTRTEYNAGRHQAPAPSTRSVAYDPKGSPLT
jgi:hypothetical protein